MNSEKDKSRNVTKRHDFADYLDIGNSEKSNFVLMGTGFTKLDETPGAQTKKKKYINEKASSSSITSYETVFPFESDLIVEQEAVLALYTVGRNHLTGSDAEFQYVRVELWDPKDGDASGSEFAARLFTVSTEISNISGDDEIAVSGNLNAVGDPVDGTFNTKTRTFTPAATDTVFAG